ncbi:MAG: hypothetical protein AAGF76_04880 [Pseudomonadota bacterium]
MTHLNKTSYATFLLATTIMTAQPSAAREVVIGLSPFAAPAALEAQVRRATQHVAETLAPGETAWLVNAMTQEQIASFHVAEGAPASIRSRMRANRAYFSAVKTFLEADHNAAADGAFPGEIDLPGFLRAVGTNYPTEGAPRDLIILGSPVTDPQSPGFSMHDGVVPNDAHINASRADSPYGSAELRDHLTGYTVHWGVVGAPWSVSDRHAHFVERFLSLSLEARGATLVTFADDLETPLRNAVAGRSAPLGPYALEASERLSMIHFQPQPVDQQEVSIYERDLSDRVPSLGEVAVAERVEIAIRWSCDCDMDLAVKPTPGSRVISFRDPLTLEGRLFKDFTSAASLNNGFEIVEVTGPVDLRALTVAVNLYRGQVARGAEGEIRLAIGAETWSRRFEIPAAQGNRGSGMAETLERGRSANDGWVVIDPLSVIVAD